MSITDSSSKPADSAVHSDHPKCMDLIFIYFSGPMISIVNLPLLKDASVEDK
jgi:hypothetical protein